MIYKLGGPGDLEHIPSLSPEAREVLLKYLQVLAEEYGENRDLDHDMGGYLLYCQPGTKQEELLSVFDYREHLLEWVEWGRNLCVGLFLLTDDYGVVLVMAKEDAPKEMFKETERGYQWNTK